MPRREFYSVYLPKFGLRMRESLNQPLQALGLNTMFDATKANFSGMVLDNGVAVSEVLHEAMIEVRYRVCDILTRIKCCYIFIMMYILPKVLLWLLLLM